MSEWIQTAVIYEIIIDRFAGYRADADDTKPEWCGGNLAGITAKLDYLVGLGVTAIWLTPFFQTHDYHGYSTTDLYSVDPHFGTLEDAKELVRQCHARGLNFIMDFTANHVSEHHPYFVEARDNPDSQYRDWFYFDNENSKKYLTFLDFSSLPKLNLDFEPAREHIISSALYWIRELGVDGIRLDHAVGPSLGFWQEFGQRCREISPNIVLLGEVAFFGVKPSDLKTFNLVGARRIYWQNKLFGGDPYKLAMKKYVGILDGSFDFGFRALLEEFALGKLGEKGLQNKLLRHYSGFGDDFALPTFLENQDFSRYLYLTGQDYDKLKSALEIQFGVAQPKVIYYGAEVAMTHEVEAIANSGWAGDLPTRRKMNWTPNAKEQELLAFYKDLIARSKASS